MCVCMCFSLKHKAHAQGNQWDTVSKGSLFRERQGHTKLPHGRKLTASARGSATLRAPVGCVAYRETRWIRSNRNSNKWTAEQFDSDVITAVPVIAKNERVGAMR